MPDAQPPSFPAIVHGLSASWSATPWTASEVHYDGESYHGVFDVDLTNGSDAPTPYRPVLHGPVLAQIASFHALASLLYAYAHRLHPAFETVPDIGVGEARKRMMVTSMRLSMRRPVSERTVPLRLTLTRLTGRSWQSHRMLFGETRIEVAEGRQQAWIDGCFNFRDAVDS
ncbi:hypothetical protein ACFVIM_33450 [Streptomyces sp. NPDC057638]|uniref:hypothetical protein n=1 Tax=Streptomyces sp. NPDC057638 TaxID=3346190 RepID=UPI00368DA63F